MREGISLRSPFEGLLTQSLTLALIQWTQEACRRWATSRQNGLSVSRTAQQKKTHKDRPKWLLSPLQVSILGWFISATSCLGNMIISPVPHWPRQIRLTRLKLIGPGQKWEPMRLELSACEKWSTLLLKGERVSARNSTAVVAMESHFLVRKLKRLDWRALNYN